MSGGGLSLHKSDWLKLAALTAAAGTGAGMAGIGPLAGLLGAPSAAGALGTAGAVGEGLTGAADLAAGGAATPGIASTIAQTSMFGNALPTGLLSKTMKGAAFGQKAAGLLSPQQPQQPVQMPRGGMSQPPAPTQLFSQSAPTMPLDLLGLPPTDPRVVAWKQQNGITS
jgi:hypothetical protein